MKKTFRNTCVISVLSVTKKQKKICCFDETSYFWVILSSFVFPRPSTRLLCHIT